MEAIAYLLFFLVIINFYLIFRKRDTLSGVEKFMISLMAIFMVYIFLQCVGLLFATYFDQEKQNKLFSPLFVNTVLISMNLILPIIATEIVLAGYLYLDRRKKSKQASKKSK